MGSKNDFVNTGLGLGLSSSNHHHKITKQVSLKHEDHLFTSLTLSLSPEDHTHRPLLVKREKEEAEIERVASMSMSSRAISDPEDEEGSPRKKLRLTKQQSATLEDSFKQHSTLNPKQKQVLAAQLNLRPRQVEVWFQNRRARTKLKQTEEDCEVLKKCCETLTEENKRLKKELRELKALKLTTSLYMELQPPPATLTICPCCHERLGGGANPDHHHLFNPLTHPSAAC